MWYGKGIPFFRKLKIAQLIILSVLELIFLILLITNVSLREAFLTSSPFQAVGILNLVVYFLSLLSIYLDFKQFEILANNGKELHNLAYMDRTGLPNRRSLDMHFNAYEEDSSVQNVGCCLFTIESLGELNDIFGREAGDKMIQSFCTILEETGKQYGYVGRNGGNEFIVIIDNCTKAMITLFYATLDKRIYLYNEENPFATIKIKRAYTLNSEEHHTGFGALLTATYAKL